MNREVRVGLMFVLSLVILGTSLYFLGSFQELVNYKIRFGKVNGLAVDSPVQFNGVPMGRVTKIVLSEDAQTQRQVEIIVSIALHKSLRNHIRTSTVADIKSVGILGDKSILLITKDYSADLLQEGEFIQPAPNMLDVDKLLEQGTDMVDDVVEITKNMKIILEQLAQGDGTLQRVIGDREMAERLKTATMETLRRLEKDDNLLSLLLNDPQLAARVRDGVTTILEDSAALSAQYKDGNGLLPALMTDEKFKHEVQEKLFTLLDTTQTYIQQLEESRGLVHRLTRDEAYGERVAGNIEKASFHLASILEKIDQGEGTASLMLNDPSLYEGLYEVVYGIQHSGLSKWYIRKKQKKGAQLKKKMEDANKQDGGTP